jgi:hypothetical protein
VNHVFSQIHVRVAYLFLVLTALPRIREHIKDVLGIREHIRDFSPQNTPQRQLKLLLYTLYSLDRSCLGKNMQSGVCLSVEVENVNLIMFWLPHLLRVILRVENSTCINHRFDYNSEGVAYLVTYKACEMQYVGCTITSFRLRFNNHKSSLNRYGQGIRNISGQHLYKHFFREERRRGLSDFWIQIIDIVLMLSTLRERESYWIEKINCYYPLGLNMREESNYHSLIYVNFEYKGL